MSKYTFINRNHKRLFTLACMHKAAILLARQIDRKTEIPALRSDRRVYVRLAWETRVELNRVREEGRTR